MRHEDAIEFIGGIARMGSKPGLERVRALLDLAGNPQDSLRFIHVAGTNGKGSTCAMLSRVLVEAGYKTGLYISPYVIDFRERIQVNNEMISEIELAKSTAFVKSQWELLDAAGMPPTEFEVVLAVAMDYFTRSNCDIVVLEVGLGGRLDATNIIRTPLCSVITSIGADHTEYLGETIGEIAAEKCGIIKPGGITVSYPRQPAEAQRVIADICAERGNRLLVAENPVISDMGVTGCDIECGGLSVRVPLAGKHQALNAATVIETFKAVRMNGLGVGVGAVARGIGTASFPARLEILREDPLVLLDGAHNPSGAKALAESLELLGGRRIHAVTGMMGDKDIPGVLREVLPLCASVTVCAPSVPRAMPAPELAKLATVHCENVYSAGSASGALARAAELCGNDGAVLIFGSLYLAAEIRADARRLFSTGKSGQS